MGTEAGHHVEGILVGVTAAEPDQVDALLAVGIDDFAGDVVGAFDQIDDQDRVADAFAAVLPQETLKFGFRRHTVAPLQVHPVPEFSV